MTTTRGILGGRSRSRFFQESEPFDRQDDTERCLYGVTSVLKDSHVVLLGPKAIICRVLGHFEP